MKSFPLDRFDGYTSKTFSFKSTPEGSIFIDVIYPEETDSSPSTVLVHYHGGFLIVGDRYTFLPYWLIHACASRKWIFVTPDYRLMPETAAHSAIEDAKDAYAWVRSSLSDLLGRSVGTVHVAGSSAGGYLALSTSMTAVETPDSLLLIYGMLDPAGSRYTTTGSNIFGRPVIDTEPVFHDFPNGGKTADKKAISAYPLIGDPARDRRFALVSALHIDARFPDYMSDGVQAVPKEHKILFPCSFGDLANVPRTMLLHGLNDSAVPVENSLKAADKLREAGVPVITEFPEDAEHGFDARAGNVNVEGEEGNSVIAVESLRRAIRFLDSEDQLQ
ncbi:Alpha/Beta hydrolase protein [Dactylonectria macrodidyma]|uniref:Alpha/Beta hydrolase protein n=1 Tax=Dactylonectria macrodidyma TaxID=307937 RepID=A0A9P9FNJ2_9HYPO|nr:Alpha/Beta hydrolase protein [Dactylonectria macrodidyma]